MLHWQKDTRFVDVDNRVPVAFDVELTMAAPAWVQDNSPNKVAAMSAEEAEEADDVSVELESDLGTTRINGSTVFSSFHILETENGGFNLQQSGAL